jgi:hypothetical protein
MAVLQAGGGGNALAGWLKTEEERIRAEGAGSVGVVALVIREPRGGVEGRGGDDLFRTSTNPKEEAG